MTTELVSVRISFYPDDGSEQSSHTREFIIAGRTHADVMARFREFCDLLGDVALPEPEGQQAINYLGKQPSKKEDGDG